MEDRLIQYYRLEEILDSIGGLWTGKKEPLIEVNVYTMTNFTKDCRINQEPPRRVLANEKEFKRRQLQLGDILIEKSGGGPNQPVGRVILFENIEKGNNSFSNFTARLRLKPNIGVDISPNYIYQFFRWMYLKGISEKYQKNSTNIRNLQLKDYLKNVIPIPNLESQSKILSKLDQAFEAIDQAIANTEKNIENVEELEKSWFQEQFREGQADWIDSVIGDIGKVSMCKRILKKQTTTEGDIPFYKIGTFGKTPDAFITKKLFSEYVEKYSFPKKGDVLISASGTIGRRVRFNGKPSYFQDSNIVWIANDEQHVLNDFLYEFYGYCNWNPTSGATIKRLYNDDLRKIKISYPKSLSQQSSLVEKMQNFRYQIESVSSSYRMKLTELKELKMSILEKAFKGELV